MKSRMQEYLELLHMEAEVGVNQPVSKKGERVYFATTANIVRC